MSVPESERKRSLNGSVLGGAVQENTWEQRENKQSQRREEEEEAEERQDDEGKLNRESERGGTAAV